MNVFRRVKLAFLAARPWTFSITIISVTLGSIIAFQTGQFRWGRYVLSVLGMSLAQAATNLLNDYYDFKNGVDVAGAHTTLYRRHPIVSGDFSPETVLRISIACYVTVALIGGYFFLLHGWLIVVFVGLGGFGGICYTAGPIHFKYRAIGEISVFLIWGPLMMSACYFVHAGNWERLGSVLLLFIPRDCGWH